MMKYYLVVGAGADGGSTLQTMLTEAILLIELERIVITLFCRPILPSELNVAFISLSLLMCFVIMISFE